jgi:two-component system KDP operon response regulator KdpE
MGQLRAKLETDPGDPQRLLTEPGIGYRLVDPDA